MQQIDYEEGKKLTETHACGECGSPLVLPWGGAFGIDGYVVMCAQNPEHQGFTKAPSYTQAHRRGDLVPLHIENKIIARTLPTDDLSRMMNLVAVKFPFANLDAPSAALFIMDCLRLDLDPLLGEAVPVPFKGKNDKKVIQLIITEDGYLSMAARACPEKWQGPPMVEPVTDKDLKREICGEENAWVWKATGRTRDMAPGQVSIAYGWVKTEEIQTDTAKLTPKDKLPGNQARVRAVKRWVKENFPEAKARMKEMTAEWMQRAEGVEQAEAFIDAEYRVLGENGEEKPKAKPQPAAKPGVATENQIKAIFAISKELGVEGDTVKERVKEKYHLADFNDLTKEQASEIIGELQRAQKASE